MLHKAPTSRSVQLRESTSPTSAAVSCVSNSARAPDLPDDELVTRVVAPKSLPTLAEATQYRPFADFMPRDGTAPRRSSKDEFPRFCSRQDALLGPDELPEAMERPVPG